MSIERPTENFDINDAKEPMPAVDDKFADNRMVSGGSCSGCGNCNGGCGGCHAGTEAVSQKD